MEQKNRGTYKVNPNKTPKENVLALLAMVAPMETTMAKMTGELTAKADNVPYWHRRADTFNLNNVNAFPSSRNRWCDCTEIQDFQRVCFQTKTPRNVNYRREIMRSVPVVKGKISLTKVTRILAEFTEHHKKYEAEQKQDEIEREKRRKQEEAKQKRLEKVRKTANLPHEKVDVRSSNYRDDCTTYSIDISDLSEEQALTIADKIRDIVEQAVREEKKALEEARRQAKPEAKGAE